jgi:hypothetical protein
MTYNIYIKHDTGSFNIIGVSPLNIPIIQLAYMRGDYGFTLNHTHYHWGNLKDIQIIENKNELSEYCAKLIGKDVTSDFLNDLQFKMEIHISKAS